MRTGLNILSKGETTTLYHIQDFERAQEPEGGLQ